MGRLERPLNPEAGEVERFAADLRALRERAGQPTYRQLALQAHYAVTTLSQAAAGNRLPTLEVALAYVRACGADETAQQEWCRRWQQLARQLDPDHRTVSPGRRRLNSEDRPSARRGARQPQRKPARLGWPAWCWPAFSSSPPSCSPLPPIRQPDRRHGPRPASARRRRPTTIRLRGGRSQPGCRRRRGPGPLQRVYGRVFLRYSPGCLSAWPRFQDNALTPRGSHLLLATIRPTDHRETDYADVFQGEWIWGNMLQTTRGCVMVKAVLTVAGQPPAVGLTRCVHPNP